MTQDDLDDLEASGLRPIVIDENFDFALLNFLISNPPAPKEIDEQVGKRTTQADGGTAGDGIFPPS